MKGQILRIFVLLWLAWYVWGPLDPVFDYWDTPRQTMSDMERSANGTVVLIAGVFVFASLQVRKLRERFHRSLLVVQTAVASPPRPTCAAALALVPIQLIHAPPAPLRI
ncbi:MAG TPA: hypothetical protein VFL79_07720 [Terriglobia bacterium]|nr:hypothetical protein [Terriglobia bacterium]